MIRMLMQAFTKGKQGCHHLIADVGAAENLKDIEVHSKRVPGFILPDSYLLEESPWCL